MCISLLWKAAWFPRYANKCGRSYLAAGADVISKDKPKKWRIFQQLQVAVKFFEKFRSKFNLRNSNGNKNEDNHPISKSFRITFCDLDKNRKSYFEE